MQPLSVRPVLIDQAYERLLAAIAEGTLPAGGRIRQEELAGRLGVSRQPISHALQILKRQGLVAETGKRGLTVTTIEPARIRDLYEVRTALDALAARLAARRSARRAIDAAAWRETEEALAAGLALDPADGVAAFVRADVAFHSALYRLSGNTAIEETVSAQWPHLMRSMAVALTDTDLRLRVWAEHRAIWEQISAGHAEGAEQLAAAHTATAAAETCRRLEAATDGME